MESATQLTPSNNPSADEDLTFLEEIELGTTPSSPSNNPIKQTGGLGGHRFYEYFKLWKWEVLASIMLAVSLFAIPATLYPMQGRSLPQWPYHITINTIIAMYAAIVKATMSIILASCIGQLQWSRFSSARPMYNLVLYDQAGRGAWGSLTWLWKHRISSLLTAVGAVLITVIIAIEPVAQQLVHLRDCSVAMGSENATLPQTNFFNPYRNEEDQVEDPTQCLLGSDLVQRAVLAGLGSSASIKCWDISDKILFNLSCQQRSASSGDILTYTAIEDITDCPPDHVVEFKSALPSGLETVFAFRQKYSMPPEADITEWLTMFSVLQQFGPWGDGRNVSLNSAIPPSVTFQMLAGRTPFSDRRIDPTNGQNLTGCDADPIPDGTLWRCRGYGAAQCSLYPCVRTYEATVDRGLLIENVVRHSEPMTWRTGPLPEVSRAVSDPFMVGMADPQCMSSDEWERLRGNLTFGRNGSKSGLSEFVPYSLFWDNATIHGAEYPLIQSLLDRECLYLMHHAFDTTFIPSIMSGLFYGAVRASTFRPLAQTDECMTGIKFVGSLNGPPFPLLLYNYGQISYEQIASAFKNISSTLTLVIRTQGDRRWSRPAVGCVMKATACLDVRWAWIAFPLALMVATYTFLAVVIVSAARERVPIWM
ncbi:hypothetical protein B0T22DRAFT_511152 [Podospora appendiculata]|uniref:Uncharacterized protein n=1 Tax=Podospora appendiculata TaxID=314037 RepID=A0AAE0X8E6_9PEZI|nr:hypothetical protein B0T22DRAFT_511152 [Podospora appendiculata]